MSALKTIAQAWKVKEIRQKMIFTFWMLVVFRVGSNIPVPGMNRDVLSEVFNGGTGLFALFDLFSGGAFSQFTIFALSITPYITASVILQLLTVAIPALERLAKEGTEGRKKMAQYTRYLTVVLALVQAIGLTIGLFRRALIDHSFFSVVVIVLTLAAGTAFLMWLGEQINERGIGNGISLLIFAGIVSRVPTAVHNTAIKLINGQIGIISMIVFLLFAVLVIVGIIMIQQGTRKIPVQYAKRVVGRKMYGGQSTHLPIKVNQAGVMPVIFAISLLQFPMTLTYFWPNSGFAAFVTNWLSPYGNPGGVVIYTVLNAALIIAFTYFYTAISFNPVEVSNNLKNNGGFIPGIRPGRPTTEYVAKVMSRLTFVGAIFLVIIAVMPTIISQFTAIDFNFGGTSLLIAVGVALDTVKQLENQMLMRNYEGFLK